LSIASAAHDAPVILRLRRGPTPSPKDPTSFALFGPLTSPAAAAAAAAAAADDDDDDEEEEEEEEEAASEAEAGRAAIRVGGARRPRPQSLAPGGSSPRASARLLT
jgi:hypothetical protein